MPWGNEISEGQAIVDLLSQDRHEGKKLVAERACIKAPSLTELREAAKKRAHLDEKQGEPIPVPGGGHC